LVDTFTCLSKVSALSLALLTVALVSVMALCLAKLKHHTGCD
jgi:hypothetical protein